MNSFSFWHKYLQVVSLLLIVQGIFWAIYGSFDPFGFYDGIFAQAFYNQPLLPANVQKAKQFLLSPFGATDAGYFILMFFLVKYPLAKKEKWAYKALLTAFFVWFLLDSTMSMIHGAYFNVYIVNLPCFVLLGIPLLVLGKYMQSDDHTTTESANTHE